MRIAAQPVSSKFHNLLELSLITTTQIKNVLKNSLCWHGQIVNQPQYVLTLNQTQ